MIKKGTVLLLVIIILLSFFLVPTDPIAANSYQRCDYWEYEAEHFLQGLSITGTTRIDFQGRQTIYVGGTEYDTIYFDWTGEGTFSGTASGMQVSGNVTLSGGQYFQESNEELVKSIEDYIFDGTYSYPGSSGEWLLTYDSESSYALSVDEKVLKTEVGDLGHSEAMVTFNVTTQVKMDGNVVDSSSQNVTFPEIKTYTCVKEEAVTVPAGTFDCFLINTSKSDGTYKHDWRSTKVGNSVKVIAYNQTQDEQWRMELAEYSHEPESGDTIFGMPVSDFLVIVSLITVVVIIIIFYLTIGRRR